MKPYMYVVSIPLKPFELDFTDFVYYSPFPIRPSGNLYNHLLSHGHRSASPRYYDLSFHHGRRTTSIASLVRGLHREEAGMNAFNT